MKRREFITLLGGAAAWPLAASAQQPAMPVVGYVYGGSPEPSANQLAGFIKGLSEMGFVEGRNVTIEYRFAHNDAARLPDLVADLVRHRVAVIATPGSPQAALLAKALTTTIPIVFGTGGYPVESSLVTSLNQPGGNLTGFDFMTVELGAKRLGLLHELLPGAARFAVLVNPDNLNAEAMITEVRAAATLVSWQIDILTASNSREIDGAFASLAQKGAAALLVTPSPLFLTRRVHLATAAMHHNVPVIYSDRQYAEAGGLMSYGSNVPDGYRQIGIYVGRILKGEKPADLPVMRATKFEFVVNLQTARLLGIEVPPTLLALADEVIE